MKLVIDGKRTYMVPPESVQLVFGGEEREALALMLARGHDTISLKPKAQPPATALKLVPTGNTEETE